MEEFLELYKDRSTVEWAWLREVYTGVCEQVYPLVGVALGISVEQLVHAVVRRVQRGQHSLPVSYRFVSVSELISRQHTPCFSSLTWSTNQYREQSRGAEQHLPNHKALPRTNLLLIGVLCDGRVSGGCDGYWRVRDCSGSVHCQVLTASPLWLGKLMLFPTWNYIPHHAAGPGQEAGGYLELIDPPVCVTPDPTAFDPGGAVSYVIGVQKVSRLLRQKSSKGVCVCVCGTVSVLCPLLVISGNRFFCFILSEGGVSVPVLLTVPECVYWRQCVSLGQSVCVSALRVCSVRGWAGQRVLSVTSESRLHLNPQTEGAESQTTHSQSYTESESLTDTQLQDTHSPNTHTHTHTHLQQDRGGEEAQVHDGPSEGGRPVRTKISKIISYRGRITGVLNEEAGLYELDEKVLLCLAYQPPIKWGGGLRVGAELELHHVHFLFRPSPFVPDVVLTSCLRSTVSVSAFSPLTSQATPQMSDGALVRILFEKNLDVSQYLWLCYSQRALRERLCPRWVCVERVCVVAGRLLQLVLGGEETKKEKREIYREMMQDTHTCPVTEYRVCSPAVSLYSVKELCDWMQKESWACLSSLSLLLPPSAYHMTQAELNPLLSWSAHTLALENTHTLLVGVMELSSSRGVVRLVDQTGAVECVCVQRQSSGGRCVAISTAWIGSLVCIQRCTLVMERFMKTEFPSWKHLDQQKYIKHKHCRTYICVYMDDLHILSPSAAMRQTESDSSRQSKRRKIKETRLDPRPGGGPRTETPPTNKRKRETEVEVEGTGGGSCPCVSLLFCVLSKQGVAFSNLQTADEARGLTRSFVAKVTRLGDAQVWDGDPKNRSVEQREMEGGGDTVELQFVNSSVRWFPVLQPGTVYRLITLNTQDVGVLSCSTVPVRGGVSLLSSPTLLIQPQWRLHTLTPPPLLPQLEVQKLLSVSEVLTSSADVVSFHGVISERITLQDDRKKSPAIQSLISAKAGVMEEDLRVRLTLQDPEAPPHSIQVYLDFTYCPYSPGLVAGATVQLLRVQRKVSAVGNVYCSSLPISCVTVTGLRCAKPRPPLPVMCLGEWALVRADRSPAAEVRVHAVCVLSLRLQWACSLCGSVFRQGSCSRSFPPCDSSSTVFQAQAKLAAEDGTGEAQVWFPTQTVAKLLQLSDTEWEGLQRLIRGRGHVRVYTRGRTMVSDVDPDDPLVVYLCCLCSSSTVCRHLTLTCKVRLHKPETAHLRKVSRGAQEFLTKFQQPLQLHCTHIHTQ